MRAEEHDWAEARPLLEKAIRFERAAVQAKPRQARYLTWLGTHYEWLGKACNFLQQPAAAEEALREAVASRSQSAVTYPQVPGYRYQLANAYTVLAMHLHAAGRYSEAEQSYRQALETNRDLATLYPSKQFCQRHLGLSYHLLGVLLQDMGKNQEAKRLHREGLIAGAQPPSAFQDRADFQIVVCKMIAYVAGQLFPLGERSLAFHFLEQATQYQEAALKAKPNHKPYLQALQARRIDLFWKLVPYPDPQFLKPGQMLEFAKKAIDIDSKTGTAWQMYGIARYRLGDWKGAIAALQKSLEVSKTETEITKVSAWFFLAMASERLGEHAKARSWYAKAVQGMEHPSSIDYRRLIYADLLRFRAEAAASLGIKDQPMPKGNPEPTAKN
jgi:tetratricopeptide (TPR) repeat protein